MCHIVPCGCYSAANFCDHRVLNAHRASLIWSPFWCHFPPFCSNPWQGDIVKLAANIVYKCIQVFRTTDRGIFSRACLRACSASHSPASLITLCNQVCHALVSPQAKSPPPSPRNAGICRNQSEASDFFFVLSWSGPSGGLSSWMFGLRSGSPFLAVRMVWLP